MEKTFLRELYRLYIPFHMIFSRWTEYSPGTLLGKPAQSIGPYWSWSTVEKGDKNRLFVTRGGLCWLLSLGSTTWRRSMHLVRISRSIGSSRTQHLSIRLPLIGDEFVYGAMDDELMNGEMKLWRGSEMGVFASGGSP